VEAAGETSRDELKKEEQRSPKAAPASSQNGKPIPIEPDLDFIRALGREGGGALKKCFQCGTCSATCALAPDQKPFPRKEMAWAVWGMKDRLLTDPDVWLCHQCNDCSLRCPRGARPGDVLGAIRQASVAHYSVPRFLGRWVSRPSCAPLLLAIPVALLTLAILSRDLLLLFLKSGEGATAGSSFGAERIIFSYSSMLPHWLLNSFFGLFTVLMVLAMAASVRRFWRAMEAADAQNGIPLPDKPLRPSIIATLKSVITHDKFTQCTEARLRYFSHLAVVFGFLALSLVAIWVVTAKINPLIPNGMVYPFSLFDPWKIMANAAGAAVLGGCLLMIWERMRDPDHRGAYADWVLIGTIMIVVLTGFAAEAFHIIRLEPHRHAAYFVHLVFVFSLLMYLPYSKFAHVVYRTVAMVYAEHSGRGAAPDDGQEEEQ
jgi:quinone-modifying oxidoreductase subunit QmoC